MINKIYKSVIITGAADGIGLETLKRLLKETNSDEIAFLIGDFVDLETAYLSKKLSDSLKKFK